MMGYEPKEMTQTVEAIYEDGVLKLQQPLLLKNQERVRGTVERFERRTHSVLDIPPVSLGRALQPLNTDDDTLGEMLEDRE